jgi:hypothetical protein
MEPQTNQQTIMMLPSIGDLFNRSKETVMKRKEFFFTLALIPAAIQFLGGLLVAISPGFVFLLPIFVIASVIVGVYATVGMIKAMKDDSLNQWKAGLSAGKGYFWSIFFTGIIISIVVMIGFLLLILPGIFLAVSVAFYTYTLVLEDKKYWAAAQASMDLVKGNWWAVFGRLLAFGILVGLFVMVLSGLGALGGEIVGQIVSTIASILITPISIAYSYYLYMALKEKKATMPQVAAAQTPPPAPQA